MLVKETKAIVYRLQQLLKLQGFIVDTQSKTPVIDIGFCNDEVCIQFADHARSYKIGQGLLDYLKQLAKTITLM